MLGGNRTGRKVGVMKGEELLNFVSVQEWIKSLECSAISRGKPFTLSAKRARLGRLWEYTEEGKISPDNLLEEAQQNIDNAGQRLNKYFQEKVDAGNGWNTACTNVSFLRGFYSHNNLFFPKKYRLPRRQVSRVSKRDSKTEIYGYDEENDEIIFKNGILQHFVQNLNFRDQTIALCLLSTGADSTDLFKLNVGFVKDGRGRVSDIKRFLWHDNRLKDGIEFKVYFSEESTEFLKRFVEQERSNVSDDEPLFAKEDGKRMDSHALSVNFRVSAKKMGYTKNGQSSPFRPKRFRHLFRTACGNANVDSGYIMTFMGHASNVSASYLEKGNGMFLREYIKVESYLTVFGVNKQKVTEMTEALEGLKSEVGVLAEAGKIIKNRTMSIEEKNVELEKILKQRDQYIESLKTELEIVRTRQEETFGMVDATRSQLEGSLAERDGEVKDLKQKIARLESVYEATAQLYKQLEPKKLEKTIREIMEELKHKED